MDNSEAIYRLEEIQDELFDLLNEAKGIVRQNFPRHRAAAEAYWVGHMASAFGSNDYPTHATTLGKTIANIKEEVNEEWEEEHE